MSTVDTRWMNDLPDIPDSPDSMPQFNERQLAGVTAVIDPGPYHENMPHISLDGGETYTQPDTPMLDAIKRNMANMLVLGLSHFGGLGLPDTPAPKPARKVTAADREALAKAEAKRARRAARNKGRGL